MFQTKPLLILAALLTVSVGINLLQLRQSGKARAACDARISALQAATIAASLDRDADSLSVAREATESADAVDADISQNTNEATERVRTIIREIPVPANCPVSLPERVQDELANAAAAANRRL